MDAMDLERQQKQSGGRLIFSLLLRLLAFFIISFLFQYKKYIYFYWIHWCHVDSFSMNEGFVHCTLNRLNEIANKWVNETRFNSASIALKNSLKGQWNISKQFGWWLHCVLSSVLLAVDLVISVIFTGWVVSLFFIVIDWCIYCNWRWQLDVIKDRK